MGSIFNWRKDEAKTDEHAANLGSDASVSPAQSATAPAQGSVSSATRASAGAAAREGLRARRGRPSNAENSARVDSDAQNRQLVNEAIASQLERLHDPKLWESLLCMPAAGMLAVTGKGRWEISKEERVTMGLSGSALASTMMITNPRALAAFMFISVMGTAYLPRALAELKDLAAKKKAEKKEEPANAVPKS